MPQNTDWNYWLMNIMLEIKKERDIILEEANIKSINSRLILTLMYHLPMNIKSKK